MRIFLASEAITSSGTVGSYTFHALSADTRIVDVDISTPDDGARKVHITVHGDGSISDDELADKVYRVIQDEEVKVLCVKYTTSPQRTNTIDKVGNISEMSERKRIIGIDIVESQIIDVIHNVDGVYQAKLKGSLANEHTKRFETVDTNIESVKALANEPKTAAAKNADTKADTAQTTENQAKTDAVNAAKKLKPISEDETGATTAANARKNLRIDNLAGTIQYALIDFGLIKGRQRIVKANPFGNNKHLALQF